MSAILFIFIHFKLDSTWLADRLLSNLLKRGTQGIRIFQICIVDPRILRQFLDRDPSFPKVVSLLPYGVLILRQKWSNLIQALLYKGHFMRFRL
jgi:hypothetical protein